MHHALQIYHGWYASLVCFKRAPGGEYTGKGERGQERGRESRVVAKLIHESGRYRVRINVAYGKVDLVKFFNVLHITGGLELLLRLGDGSVAMGYERRSSASVLFMRKTASFNYMNASFSVHVVSESSVSLVIAITERRGSSSSVSEEGERRRKWLGGVEETSRRRRRKKRERERKRR